MTFLPELKRLMDAATKGPWFKRYCDDDNHMCMTVISSKDYGPTNTGQFKDEPDTIAATFHQIAPVIADTPDCNEATTDLIIYLVNHAPALAELVEVTKEYYDAQQEWAKYRLALDNAEANYSDSAPDEKLFMAAVLRVNKAEHALSEALAKLNANDVAAIRKLKVSE